MSRFFVYQKLPEGWHILSFISENNYTVGSSQRIQVVFIHVFLYLFPRAHQLELRAEFLQGRCSFQVIMQFAMKKYASHVGSL